MRGGGGEGMGELEEVRREGQYKRGALRSI